jgi:hypothetical protein
MFSPHPATPYAPSLTISEHMCTLARTNGGRDPVTPCDTRARARARAHMVQGRPRAQISSSSLSLQCAVAKGATSLSGHLLNGIILNQKQMTSLTLIIIQASRAPDRRSWIVGRDDETKELGSSDRTSQIYENPDTQPKESMKRLMHGRSGRAGLPNNDLERSQSGFGRRGCALLIAFCGYFRRD